MVPHASLNCVILIMPAKGRNDTLNEAFKTSRAAAGRS
jgi:hypothetical protein